MSHRSKIPVRSLKPVQSKTQRLKAGDKLRNSETWKETKFVLKSGRLLGSSDPLEVSVGSRLTANLIAANYLPALKSHASGRLLDLGCGKAPLFGAYRDLVTEVTCVDWGSSLHQTDHLDKEADLTRPLEFPDAAFDTIILRLIIGWLSV